MQATEHNKRAKTWPAVQVSTFFCGSQGYEILIRCTRNGWGVYIDAVHVQPVSTTIQQVGKTDGIHSIRPSIPSSWTDGILIDSPYPTVSQMQSFLWSR